MDNMEVISAIVILAELPMLLPVPLSKLPPLEEAKEDMS
jgi:hypothetical protein